MSQPDIDWWRRRAAAWKALAKRQREQMLSTHLKRFGRVVRDAAEQLRLMEPIGNCDGSGLYAYDSGERLDELCPGCRACK